MYKYRNIGQNINAILKHCNVTRGVTVEMVNGYCKYISVIYESNVVS